MLHHCCCSPIVCVRAGKNAAATKQSTIHCSVVLLLMSQTTTTTRGLLLFMLCTLQLHFVQSGCAVRRRSRGAERERRRNKDAQIVCGLRCNCARWQQNMGNYLEEYETIIAVCGFSAAAVLVQCRVQKNQQNVNAMTLSLRNV